MDEQMMRLVGDVDVIFCRNVLIYFDTAARKKVISSLHGKLVKGGYLLLGHSESLINLSTAFDLVHLKNDMVYRKPWNG
jgi:chemotaxis protein methyltransferase CheR